MRSGNVYKSCIALAVVALYVAGPAFSANCTAPITANTSTTQTVSGGATCTVNSSVTVSATADNSSQPFTLSTGTQAAPTTLINNGTIAVNVGKGPPRAVQSSGTGGWLVIQNNAGATISTNNNDTIAAGQGSSSVSSVILTNAGTIISAAGGQAVNFNKITQLTGGANSVSNSGLIQATNSDAVRTGYNGTVSNSGTIKSIAVGGSGSDGIDAQGNSGLSVMNTGLIQGGRHGITGGTNSDNAIVNLVIGVTNSLNGTIQGDDGAGINIDGLGAAEVVTISNAGNIFGTGLSRDGDGVDVDGIVNLTNTGTIRSLNSFTSSGTEFSEGVTVGGGMISNSGTIQGSVASGNSSALGRGITIAGVDKDSAGNPIPVQAPYTATTITNSGLIKGDSDSAIVFSSALSSGFSHTITNQAGGVIQTGGASAAAIVTAADNVTITNSGTIDGASSGKAITGGSGNLVLEVLGGSASILGNVQGGSGTNTARLNPGAGGSFSYSGSLSNFSQVEIQGGSVTLSGANTYTGTTRITGGTLLLDGAGRLAAGSALDLAGGALELVDAGGANGQSFSSLLLSDSSAIMLGSSSITFGGLGGVTAGETLTVTGWSAATSPGYALRFYGNLAGDANFQALIGALTINGQAAVVSFDDTYTNVSAVPLPGTLVLLLSGLGLAGLITRRRDGALMSRGC